MLRPLPYCDGISRRDEAKTIKPIINEAFVAFSGDLITDYNDLYCLFYASHLVNITMSAFVIGEATNKHYSTLPFESSVAETYLQAASQKRQTKLKLGLSRFVNFSWPFYFFKSWTSSLTNWQNTGSGAFHGRESIKQIIKLFSNAAY